MTSMTIPELYKLLNSPKFRKPAEGDLFYNFYIYQYPADKEYEMRQQIVEFQENLFCPTKYVDVLSINIFDEFCNFLDGKKFLHHPSMLKYLAEKEDADPANAASVRDTLVRNAHCKEFFEYLHNHIMSHITIEDEYGRPYIFIYGIGVIYPYLRINELLAMYEDYNIPHKYISLYFTPVRARTTHFSLRQTARPYTYWAMCQVNE